MAVENGSITVRGSHAGIGEGRAFTAGVIVGALIGALGTYALMSFSIPNAVTEGEELENAGVNVVTGGTKEPQGSLDRFGEAEQAQQLPEDEASEAPYFGPSVEVIKDTPSLPDPGFNIGL